MRRLDPLTSYLALVGGPWVVFTLHETERILGALLSASARRHAAFWSNSKRNAHSKVWRSAGYNVSRAALGRAAVRAMEPSVSLILEEHDGKIKMFVALVFSFVENATPCSPPEPKQASSSRGSGSTSTC